MSSRRGATVLAVVGAVLGCAEPSDPGGTGNPQLTIVAGGGVTDTILAEPVQALVVSVAGQPGLVVRFETVADGDHPFVLTTSLSGNQPAGLTVDTTDRNGRAAARIKLGTVAGPAVLRITVPELGLSDSARFTIRPGAAAGVGIAPQDTTVAIGKSFVARVSVVDRYHNPRSDPVTYSPGNPLVTVSGATITALAAGQGRVIARAGAAGDTLRVGIVPDGVLAAVTPSGLATFRTDGTEFRLVPNGPTAGFTADWAPNGTDIAIDGVGSSTIQVITIAGDTRAVTLGGKGGGGFEFYPEFSPDGQWLYYSRADGGYSIRRVHLDGTGDTLVVGNTGADVAPSLSPDGRQLAYVIAGPDELRLLDLADGTSRQLATNGHTPAWSPQGDRIAYVLAFTGELMLRDMSSSATRKIGQVSGYQLGIDWSPDGKWLVAHHGSGPLHLIDATTGEFIALDYTSQWTAPSWKP